MTTRKFVIDCIAVPFFIAIGTWNMSRIFESMHHDKRQADSEYMRDIWPDEATRYDELRETAELDFDQIYELRRLAHLLYRPNELTIRDALTNRITGAAMGVFFHTSYVLALGWAPIKCAREFFGR